MKKNTTLGIFIAVIIGLVAVAFFVYADGRHRVRIGNQHRQWERAGGATADIRRGWDTASNTATEAATRRSQRKASNW